mmetsp:Transcript_141079/g.393210  ORF Transcript_141079/g.393210 Transcript_141079/m.393210 type:complete len:217 (+) Transcript_141079:251-901(+)
MAATLAVLGSLLSAYGRLLRELACAPPATAATEAPSGAAGPLPSRATCFEETGEVAGTASRPGGVNSTPELLLAPGTCTCPSCTCTECSSSAMRAACAAASSLRPTSCASVSAMCASRSVAACRSSWRWASISRMLLLASRASSGCASRVPSQPASAAGGGSGWPLSALIVTSGGALFSCRSSSSCVSSSAACCSLSASFSCSLFIISPMRPSERR